MTVLRKFCGWDKPALDGILDFFVEEFRKKDELDLGSVLVVFSGGRAGRRFLEKLALLSAKENLILTPPKIITVGALPESLYTPEREIASLLESTLAWYKVLKACEPQELKLIAGINAPESAFHVWQLATATIQSLHSELSGNLLSFKEAGEKIMKMPFNREDLRWDILSRLYESYQSELASRNLIDREEARVAAIKAKTLVHDSSIVLAAVRDLNSLNQEILSSLDTRIFSLIHAPESEAANFDAFGSVIPKAWAERDLQIPLSKITCALDPADQALAALSEISRLKGNYHQSEIVIGYGDTNLLPYVETVFQDASLSLHNPSGKVLTETRIAKILNAVSKYLSAQRMPHFAELLRFPEIESLIRRTPGFETGKTDASLVAMLDEFQKRHIQSYTYSLPNVTSPWENAIHSSIKIVNELLRGFAGKASQLDHWIAAIHEFVNALITNEEGSQEVSPSDFSSVEFLQELSAVLDRITETEKDLLPALTGSEAIALILKLLGEVSLPDEREDDQLEALGWLELQLEDAPVIIVCGMNEGFVPESVNSDAFLPETVRKHLGLLDNERRYARDAFVLCALVNSAKHLSLILSRYDAMGAPISPSRLLIGNDDTQLTERVSKLYLEEPQKRSLELKEKVSSAVAWQIPPKPERLKKEINSISVTALNSYLTCPYRFYLSHVLKLKPTDDLIYEMDALGFGSLAHQIMREFSKTLSAHDSDATKDKGIISDILDQNFRQMFGSNPEPAVLIQREQLRHRLHIFTDWNAAWHEQGWVTKETEFQPPDSHSFVTVDGQSIKIEGRIDRIDYNEKEKRWAVFDYKFSEKTLDADKTHIKNDEWVNLQLPLYYRLLRQSGFQGEISLGYLNLSADVASDKILQIVEWDEDTLSSAYEFACETIRKIRNEEFWPPAEKLKFADDFAVIMGTSQFFDEENTGELGAE